MSKPQQQELARSQHTPLDPTERARQSERAAPGSEDSPDAVPEENEAGHHPEEEQDKPDPERFRQRFAGEEGDSDEGDGDDAGEGSERDDR